MTNIKKIGKSVANVPNLRFPGFEGEWESNRLTDICEINPKNETLPNSFIYIDLESVVNGLLIKEDFISKDEAPSRAQRSLSKNDILFQMVRPYQKNNLFFDREGKYVASTGYAQIRTQQNSQFIFQLLHTQKFVDKVIERCTGTSYPAVNSTDLGSIQIEYPSLKEQQKIASFLSLIDEKIATQSKIIKELEVFKSISSKKIFTRQIRFKDSKGNNYSDWKEIKLGNIGETYSGLIGKTKEDFGIGQPYIQYKQIFDSSKIDTTKFGLVTVKSNEHQKKVKKGDVFFTVSSETPDEIGMSSVLLEDIEEIYLNSFCFGFRPNLQILNMHFARYLFRSFTFRDKIMKLAQGSTRYNLSKGEVMKLQISLPQFQEQTQIANFLSSIDSKIDIEIELLKKLEEQKKYLLQNLFV